MNWLFLALILFANVVYAEKDIKHILVLHSYHQSMTWVKDIDDAIQETLQPTDNGYVIHIENMDTKKKYTQQYLEKLKTLYSLKYRDIQFDLILSSDNNAFEFLKANRDQIFGKVPVVFCGVNFFKDSDLNGFEKVTGVAERFDARRTVETALKLYPKANSIFVINDYLNTGRAWDKTIKQQLKDLDQTIKVTYSRNQTIEELQKTLSNLPETTIVLLGVYFKDSKGAYFTYEKIGESIVSQSKNPVFALLEFNLHSGVVGGSVIGGYYQGKAMSNMAKQILDGKDISTIPVFKDGITKDIYDYVQLKKFDMNFSKVPENAIILNKPISFYEENKAILQVGLLVITALLAVIIVLLRSNEKISKSKKALEKLKNNLEVLVKERTQEIDNKNKKLLKAQQVSKMGFWELNILKNRLYWSDEIFKIFEMNPQEFEASYDGFLSVIHPEDRDKVNAAYANSLKTKLDYSITHRLLLNNGNIKWVKEECHSEFDKNGTPLTSVGIVIDITEDKRKEEALIKSNQRFESSEKIGNTGAWEYDIETDRFWASDQAKKIYGASNLNSDSIIDLALVESCIPEKDRVHKALIALIENDAEYHLDYEINPLDGSPSKVISSTAQVLRDDNGNALKVIGSIRDITEKARLQKALEKEKNRFTLAIEGAQDGLWEWNLQSNELFLSDRFETMLGYRIGELSKTIDAWFGLLHPDDKTEATRVVQEYLDSKGEQIYENTFRLRTKDNAYRWILARGKAEFDEDGKPLRFVGFNTDITKQRELQNKLDHSAKHDTLTQLPNRFLLLDLLKQQMHNLKRSNKLLALLFVDLDGFKEVNDNYGHTAGDEVLSTIASRMVHVVRESDIVSRIGGDEFIIVLTDLNKREEVTPLVQRLLTDIAYSIEHQQYSMQVSASIGVTFYPQDTDIGHEGLIRQADQAMYKAKQSGKNQFKFFEPDHE